MYGAVADLNASLPNDRRLPLAGGSAVFSAIDSLGVLNLLLRIEERLSESTGVPCDLVGADGYERILLEARTLDDLVHGVSASLDEGSP